MTASIATQKDCWHCDKLSILVHMFEIFYSPKTHQHNTFYFSSQRTVPNEEITLPIISVFQVRLSK